VICYVRRQDDYVESAYRHRVKVGAAGGPMGSFVSRHVNAADLGVVHANYHRVLAPWRRCFGAQAMVVRPFDEARFAGGDLLTDFLCAAGLDGIRLPRRPAARANRAVPAELVRVLRVVNEAGSIPADEHPSFVRYLRARHEFADYPLLDATTRARILANYADSNRQLFAQYGLDGDWSAPASAAAPGNAAMARDDDAVRLANLYCDAWRHRNARWGRRSALRLRALARRARYVYGDGVFYLVALCRAQLPTAALSRRAYLRLLGRMMLQRDFSPSYYSQTHLDIRAAGLDPLLHYLQYGWREARIPHPARSERDARGIADRIAAGEHPYLCDWVRRVTPT